MSYRGSYLVLIEFVVSTPVLFKDNGISTHGWCMTTTSANAVVVDVDTGSFGLWLF